MRRVAEADNKGQCGMKILPSSQYYTLSSSRRPTVGNFLWFLSRLKSRAAEGQVRRVHLGNPAISTNARKLCEKNAIITTPDFNFAI